MTYLTLVCLRVCVDASLLCEVYGGVDLFQELNVTTNKETLGFVHSNNDTLWFSHIAIPERLNERTFWLHGLLKSGFISR